MENIVHDNLSYANDKEIKDIIKDEQLLLSTNIIKINQYNMSQDRTFLITSAAIYNLKKKDLKRRIVLKDVRGITISSLTDEFVLHGMELEYDYDFVSSERGTILKVLAYAYKNATSTPLKVCLVEDKTLKKYVTVKKEKKKDGTFSRMDETKLIDVQDYFKELENKIENLNINKENENANDDQEDAVRRKKRTNTLYSRHKEVTSVSLDDFKIINVLGRGSFGKVCLVEYKPTKEHYAMKSLKKDVLLDQDHVESTLLEKKILQTVEHPFLVGMVFCFQTEERIYFIMPFIRGGELFQHLRNFRFFEEDKVRFYAAIIGMGLEHMHSHGIVYRDIKPENILMDEDGYLKIADFGMAKILNNDEKATSFCGTPEYLAPEIITGEGHNATADWWSFGILIYEMLCGIPPFYCDNTEKMYELITKAELRFPKKIQISQNAKDLISQLLIKKQDKRLGSKGGFEEIKKFHFFDSIDFDALYHKKIPAPFKPALNGSLDLQNFDSEFTSQDTVASAIPERKLEYIKRNQDKFEEFNK